MPIRMRWACLCGAVILLLGLAVSGPLGSAPLPPEPPSDTPAASDPETVDGGRFLPLDELAPQFLGMFRKTLTIEDDLRRHAERYGVDFDLARAVLIQESGGNPHLTSVAGAGGYFQVMPATFRGLRVETNVEAGIKYISQMVRQFGREDYAVAAYNGGPSRARRGRPPLETLQYVLSVGTYRSLLKMHEPSIRHHADLIRLEPIRRGDDWWTLSQRTGASLLELRMHNPFLATRALREGQFIAYPRDPRPDLLVPAGPDHVEYRARRGDNYLHLAFLLEVDRDELRELNDLWHLQTLPPGQVLRLPLAWEGRHTVYTVQEGDDLPSVAEKLESTPWRIIRDNALFWSTELTPGTALRVREAAPKAVDVTHRVVRGDTLGAIARRYGSSVRALQNANNLGRRTVIRIGQRLRIPVRSQR